MALLGESLVEEWLNREGFFTIRGVKHGVGEMDLLAVQPQKNREVIGWHVEVQISFRPIGFISRLPKNSTHNRRSVRARTEQELDGCARQWVLEKFRDKRKQHLRDQLWPGVTWEFHFVHAVVKDPRELEIIASEGVTLHAFHEILSTLGKRNAQSFSGSAGGDLAEIVSYYRSFDKQ
jgi:Holliday junction resolvase-like predicted endonuclease